MASHAAAYWVAIDAGITAAARDGMRMGSNAGVVGGAARVARIEAENARLRSEIAHAHEVIERAEMCFAVGALAAGIAHEIRNPLVSMHTFLQLASGRLDDDDLASFARVAAAEVDRINQLIDELLALGKPPAAAATAAAPEAGVDEAVGRVVTLLTPQARAQRVELVRLPSPALLPAARIDPGRLVQVLLNLGLNGLQATPSGGRVTIAAAAAERGRACRIEIGDGGPGISHEIRGSIFEPFFTTKAGGTGLGLPIAARLVAEAGGRIEVESTEGRGSSFAVYLPAA